MGNFSTLNTRFNSVHLNAVNANNTDSAQCLIRDILFLLDVHLIFDNIYEPQHDKTNKMACAPSKDSDQPGHSPSLISLRCALNG